MPTGTGSPRKRNIRDGLTGAAAKDTSNLPQARAAEDIKVIAGKAENTRTNKVESGGVDN
jgi:hypothetical protein